MLEILFTTGHPVAQCVDLRATFAGRFRFAWDPAYAAERPEFRKVEAPWLTIIPGRYGTIVPWGGRRLAAYTRNFAARQAFAALDGVTVHQGGGRCPEVIVSFDVALVETVAAILKSKRPFRKPSPAEADRLRAFRFPSKGAAADRVSGTPDSTIAAPDGGTPAA